MSFNWIHYKYLNPDLQFNTQDAYIRHYSIKGKNEQRKCNIYMEYPDFDYKQYALNYSDLSRFDKLFLENHWLKYGRTTKENRTYKKKEVINNIINNFNIDEKKINDIINDINIDEKKIKQYKQKYNPEDKFIICISGIIDINTYPKSLLEAIKLLRIKGYTIELHILGKIEISMEGLTKELYDEITSYDWVKSYIINEDDMLNYLCFCNILVSNQIDIIKKYLLCNKPILCCRGKEIEALLGKDYYGFYNSNTEIEMIELFILNIFRINNISSSLQNYKTKNINNNELLKYNYIKIQNKYQNYNINQPMQQISINLDIVNKVKIILCTCIHGRSLLVKICLKEWLKLQFYKIIICYSDNIDYDNLLDFHNNERIIFVKSINFPISQKWNNCVKESKNYEHDAVMIIGSDDIITEEYYNNVCMYINNNYDYISNNKWLSYYVDYSLYLVYKYINRATNDGLGSGRVIARRILEKYDWNIYNFNLNKGLDGNSFNIFNKYLKKVAFDISLLSVICLNMNNYDDNNITKSAHGFTNCLESYRSTYNKNSVSEYIILNNK